MLRSRFFTDLGIYNPFEKNFITFAPKLAMKVLALILSLYILALTTVPCVDGLSCNPSCNVELSTGGDLNNHHQESDHCSPFCTCSCCATHVIMQEYFVQQAVYSYSVKQEEGYTRTFESNVFISIWQPPKLS
jgi:hypothetical protein